MLKEAIKEATTLEEAKRAAAAELGLEEDQLQFEILQMPQKKTLGLFGGCPAKVRAYIEITPASTAAASSVWRGVARSIRSSLSSGCCSRRTSHRLRPIKPPAPVIMMRIGVRLPVRARRGPVRSSYQDRPRLSTCC